jgi:hypothetical protein
MTHSPRSTILPPGGENTDVRSTAGPPTPPPPLPTIARQLANRDGEDLPHADPIAYLGTDRHPLSAPPIFLDLEPSHAQSAYTTAPHPKSPMAERIGLMALATLLVAPIFLGLSEATGPKNAGQSDSNITRPSRVAREVLPTSVASVEGLANPQGRSNGEPLLVAEPPAELQIPPFEIRSRPAAVEALRRAVNEKPRRQPVAPTATGFDFGAALSAVVGADIGPRQCGPEAIGAATVSVTFAPSGSATRAVVEDGPLRGTDAGSCIARHLRDVTIAPFDGELATVRTNVFVR